MRPNLYDISWKVTEPEYRDDPALSYSTLARFAREGFNKLDSLFDKVDTPSLTFGSAVDALITGGQEEFDANFIVAEFPPLKDSVVKMVRELFNRYSEQYRTIEDIPTDSIIAVSEELAFQLNWKPETRAKVVKEQGSEYYTIMYAAQGKKMSILVDIAYIDYAGEKNETRKFMKKFGNLPANIFVMFAFSMSKGYTAYGQRTGALVAVSSSKEVIEEFKNVTKYSGRATWSNINRGAMTLLVRLQQDKAAYAQFEKERDDFYELIRGRAAIFTKEAEACGLPALPYKGGFFLAVPAADPKAVCEKLHEDLVFAVPLKLGVRIAACSVATEKMPGIAEKVLKALKAVE